MIKSIEDMPGAIINSTNPALPGLLSVSFPGYSGREIVGALSMSGYAVSTGSACHSNEMEPSRIIRSMGRTTKEAIGSIRISMGIGTTEASVDDLLQKLFDLVK